MTERLFGVETEYAFSALNSRGSKVSSERMLRRLMELAGRRLKCLPDETFGGIFLQNGARFYVDCGNHPEFSTPECANPWDVVRYIQAGERILAGLAKALEEQETEVSEAAVLRSNVDYCGTGSTWGCHESYMHRRDPRVFPEQLIPHLVSRIVYTGAGGFNSLRVGRLDFTLSPRVWHLEHDVSGESTQRRGIFHTKDESLSSRGYHRLHIICGETVCSETANWLKVGTTALVVAMIDGGMRPGDGVQLGSSLAAMRDFASDPYCRRLAKLRDGRELTALGIQRHYLRHAEAQLHREFMPPFAEAVCERWSAVLDKLENAPEAVATELDWAIKFSLYTHRARRHGVAWEELATWSHVLGKLSEPWRSQLSRSGSVSLDLILAKCASSSRLAKELALFLRDRGLKWGGLKPFIKLQQELFEIDTRFGQLGDRGIFTGMDGAGVLSHRVAGVDNIEHAMENPPAIGRARLRGESISQLAGEQSHYLAGWDRIWDCQRHRWLDLSDPFTTVAPEWKEWKVDEEYLELMEGALRGNWLRGSRFRVMSEFFRQRSCTI